MFVCYKNHRQPAVGQ